MRDMDTDQGPKAKLNSFGTMPLVRYMVQAQDSAKRLPGEAAIRSMTCIIRVRQLRQLGHITCLPEADPTRQVLCIREPTSWKRPRGRPRASSLQQMGRHCWGLRMGLHGGSHPGGPTNVVGAVNGAMRCFSTYSDT